MQRAGHAGPAGAFVSETVVTGITVGTDLAMAPDGRIFIAEKAGMVRVYKNGQLPTPFIQVPANNYGERGLLGITLDPAFATNGYVYLYYVVENSPANVSGPKTARLVRVTADGDIAAPGSEVVLLGSIAGDATYSSCNDYPASADCIPAMGYGHNGGGLEFAPDGTLFLSIGDADQFLPSQDPASFSGKVVRINPDGTAPPDNPFYTGNPNGKPAKIWASGFRNPFRLTLRPGTNVPFIGDVGSSLWEEIDVGVAGANYGWPCYENTTPQVGGSVCEALWAAGSATPPAYAYAHPPGAAIVAGVFTDSVNYPPALQGTLFYGDYVRGWIKALRFDANNEVVGGPLDVLPNADGPVAFDTGPDGLVYYLSIATGEVRRIRYEAGNRSPVAVAEASVTQGVPPLQVQFTGDTSYDPDLEPITSYLWDFDDGGATSPDANPSHVFGEGTYNVTLTVEDAQGAMGMDSVVIHVGNDAPVPAIITPPNGLIYVVNDEIVFSGAANDKEDGPLPGSSLSWEVILHHCETLLASCHTHPFWQQTGSGGSFTASAGLVDPIDVFFFEIKLTATDSLRRTGSTSVVISPDTDADGLPDNLELLALGLDPFDTDTDDNATADGDEDFDADGCRNARELGADQTIGGLRDPANAWDSFDVDGNRKINLLGDILPVILAYGQGPNDPGGQGPNYSLAKDRGAKTGAYAWSRAGPDGKIGLLNDILPVILQYGHDCT